MIKIVYATIACLVIACASLVLPSIANANPPEGVVICHCTKPVSLLPPGCYVNAKGDICAQSEPGGNIDCSQYNGNCA